MRMQKKDMKKPTLRLIIASILLVAVMGIGVLVMGVYETSAYSDDFYESTSFANYYGNSIWNVSKLAVLMDKLANDTEMLDQNDTESDQDLYESELRDVEEHIRQNLNEEKRIFYRIINEGTSVVVAESNQFEKQLANAIILTTVHKGQGETLYQTAEKQRSLTLYNQYRYEDNNHNFTGEDYTIIMGVSAYNETIVAHRQGRLHHLFNRYYFYRDVNDVIGFLVLMASIMLIIILLIIIKSTKLKLLRHKEQQYTLFDAIPTDLSIAAMVAIGLFVMVALLNELTPEVIVYEEKVLLATQYAVLALTGLLVFFILELLSSLLAHLAAGTLIKKSLIYRMGKGVMTFSHKIMQGVFQGHRFRRQILGATLIIGFIVFLNIFFAIMQSAMLLILIPVDLLIAIFVIRFVLSLTTIVEHFTKTDNEESVNFKEERVVEILKPFAYALNHMEETFNEAVANAIKGEKLKTELLTNVSHDLKTPLTSMINYIKLLKQYQHSDETIQEYVSILDMKTERLKVLVDDILEISKLSSGNVQLHLQKIDINQMMNQVMGEYESAFSEKGLDIITNDFSMPMLMTADPVKLWRVFENLLTNVYKYAMSNSRVYLTTTEKKHFVSIEIKNISEKPLKQFGESKDYVERFVQGDSSRQVDGSGLGLAIAKELVTQMQGSFEITTDGDLFKVCLVFEVV